MSRSQIYARAAVVMGLLALGSGLAASCRDVVAGKGQDGVNALCDLLKQCYGDAAPDCATLTQKFTQASDTENDDFLGFLTANDCLTSCSSAKKCWDHAPVCGDPEEICTHPQECCGFTRGLASCDGQHCCIPHAVVCDRENGPPCCNGEQCFTPLPGQQPPTCGGVPPCANGQEPCTDNFECCSKQCGANGTCEEQKTCGSEGENCVLDTDCCDSEGLHCELAGETGQCRQALCTIGDMCSPEALTCNPGAPDSCCGDPSLCIPDESGILGVCFNPMLAGPSELVAFPNGFDCGSDFDCCSGYCDLSSTPVCAPAPPVCDGEVFDPNCFDTSSNVCNQCMTGMDCCSGECVNARCTCGNSECHGPYELGGPLACQLPGQGTIDKDRQDCADHVCKDDPFCCCTEWDSICIQDAAAVRAKDPNFCKLPNAAG